MPAPVDDVSSDEDSSDEDYDDTIASEDSAAIYRDWIGEMSRVDQQRIAMMLYDNYTTRFGLLKVPAAKEVALFLGITETTVRRWRKEFLTNSKEYGEDSRGKYIRYQVLMDEQFREEALEWVRNNNNVSGKKNMTAGDFAKWVNNTLLPKARDYHPEMATSITPRTARNWLYNLGFEPRSSKKGVYIDGHERTDMAEYRKIYLRRLEIISICHAPPPLCADEIPGPCFGPQRKDVVLIFHDIRYTK